MGRARARRLVFLALIVGLSARLAAAQEPAEEPPPAVEEVQKVEVVPKAETVEEEPVPADETVGKKTTWFPAGDIYPPYVADPHRAGNAAMLSFYSHTEIAESSGARTGLKAGGRFGVVRFGRLDGRRWQISIDAGLDAMFDSQYKLDNIGWDGNYGFTATTSTLGRLSYKIGLLHTSSHVGDEYMERTGRTRIDYTREELALGARYRVAPEWSAYLEVGVAYKELTEEQAPWRVQGGMEWESSRTVLGGHFVWYGALDLALWQERDWRPDLTLQGGLAARTEALTWRFGAEFSSGRVPLGEFFEDTETRFTLAFWVDL